MFEKTYKVNTVPATKVIVTITRRQMWNNFIEAWRDMVWDVYDGVDMLKEVADVFLSGEELCTNSVRELFRKGYTIFFMLEAMSVLDTPDNKNILREIVILDILDINETDSEVQRTITIPHEDINF
jgi:hypothetical protein